MKDVKDLKDSFIIGQTKQRFPFSIRLFTRVTRKIINQMLAINCRFIYANIGGDDYYLCLVRDSKTYYDVLCLNKDRVPTISELAGKTCNLITVNRDYKDSKFTIMGVEVYKAEDTVVEFVCMHLDIFLQELERVSVARLIKLSESIRVLGSSSFLIKGAKYPQKCAIIT